MSFILPMTAARAFASAPDYHQLLDQTNTSKETQDFIKEKVRSAVDLLRNIEHRRQTIYRVVECIVRSPERIFWTRVSNTSNR